MKKNTKILFGCLLAPVGLVVLAVVGLLALGVIGSMNPEFAEKVRQEQAAAEERGKAAKEKQAAAEAAKTPADHVTDAIHQKYGTGGGLLGGGEKRWADLRNVEFSADDGMILIDFNAEVISSHENAVILGLVKVGELMRLSFERPEVKQVMVRGWDEYQDTLGNREWQWWMMGLLDRDVADQVQWENVVGGDRSVRKLLEKKGTLRIRE